MSMFRNIYRHFLSEETRYWLYKLRHPDEFLRLKTGVNRHPKGNFSLRGYCEKQAIFVHITKAAGTSVASSLFGELPYHYTASQYRVIFGRKDFNRYFKFTFVRNPWDRLYSAYSYLKNGGWDDNDKAWSARNLAEINDFEQFVTQWLTADKLKSHIHFWPQSHFLLDAKGRVLVDYLGYFEEIDRDFKHIAARVNPAAVLARTNTSERGSYLDIYSPAAIAKVAELYAEDIELFGYRFDGYQRKRVEDGTLTDDE